MHQLHEEVNALTEAVKVKMVAKKPDQVGAWFEKNMLKSGQKVRLWTGRGKDDYHDVTITSVKLWPKPGDEAFIRDNLTGKTNRKDEYGWKADRKPVYEGERTSGTIMAKGRRGGTISGYFDKSLIVKLGFV